jgi:adenylate kinase family enzyme/YHS domain-containing protein
MAAADNLRTLWQSLPSVQRYGEEFESDAAATEADLDAFLANAFRSVRTNCDLADASAAAAKLRTALPASPLTVDCQPLPPLPSGAEQTAGTISRSYFETVVETVAAAWLPSGEALLSLRPASAPSPAQSPVAEKPSTKKAKPTKEEPPAEAVPPPPPPPSLAEVHFATQLDALIDAIVDDRPPRTLLPFNDVITMSLAKAISVELKTFTRIVVHPAHPACYDTMWYALGSDQDRAAITTLEEFTRWFYHWLNWCRANVTVARAEIAGRTHWLDATAATGTMRFPEFHLAAKHLARLYTREDPDAFFDEYVAAVRQAQSAIGSDVVFYAVTLPPRATQVPLPSIDALFLPDDLSMTSHERAVSERATDNRIVVIGLEGSGRTTLGKALAKQLNTAMVDVFDLALEALDTPGDELGLKVRHCIDTESPVSLDLQAALVNRCLRRPSTVHRGYVFADVPPVTDDNRGTVDAYIAACGFKEWATAAVRVRMPAEIYADWRNDARLAKQQAYENELELRRQEKEAHDAKLSAEEARAERKRDREARIERQAKIDAGEIEATEDDRAFMEAGGVGSLPEEEEPQPEVDEDGNALEPEQVLARDAAKTAAVARRILIAELNRQLHAGRDVPAHTEQHSAATLDAWKPMIDHCAARDRLVEVPSYDKTTSTVEFLVERLSLVPSVVPQRPNVAQEAVEGIEAGPDGDAQLADIYKTTLAEAGMGLSPWEAYCPVTKFDDGVLVQGSWAYSCHFRGFMYCFASARKLQRFLDQPLPYLLQSPNASLPVMLLKRNRKVLEEAGIDVEEVVRLLAAQLELTPSDLHEYYETWRSFDAECARRESLSQQRQTNDAKALKAREERQRKAREADSKKKKTEPKKKVKKEDGKDGDAGPGDGDEAKEDAPVEDAGPVVITTEQRIQTDIDAAVAKRRDAIVPHLVSCLAAISRDEALALLERRVLPESVMVLEYAKPRNPDEEDEGEAVEEDEEPEAAADGGVDDDGNPIPPKARTPKPFDQNDDKMYNKLITKLLDEFAISPDDEAPPAAADADTTDAAKAPKPRQAFTVKSLNVYGMSAADLVASIVRSFRPVIERATLPDGEELAVDDENGGEEDEEGKEKANPLLMPGRRAIHQFGNTLRYCPVTLHETRVLVTGDPANWLSYGGGRYTFVTSEALERFRVNPERYLPAAPPAIPAPRLWLLGVPFAGKRTLARSLRHDFGVLPFTLEPSFLVSVIAAACNPEGGNADGVPIPHTDPDTNSHLAAAIEIAHRLKATEAEEQRRLKAKDEALAAQAARDEARENGEDVDELDEDEEAEMQRLVEFEPEEEEAKAERVGREQRRMAAHLLCVEPFESSGYVLVSRPNSEADVEQLLEVGAFPEYVISLKLSTEAYVNRRCDQEFVKRQSEYDVQLKAVKAQRRQLLIKQRAAEIAKWRRRNIGGGDEDAGEEDMPEEPEAPSMDAVKSELEGQYDTELGLVQAVLGMLPDKRIPVVEINGDWGRETVLRTTVGALSANLKHRRALLENPLVVTFAQAQELVATGRKYLSSFRYQDPVRAARERSGVPAEVKLRPEGRGVQGEEALPEPEPPAPRVKKTKTITRENEETGETEELIVTDDEADEEEAAPEPEEDEELEPEPDLSPEELEELQQAHDAKMQKLADKKKMRACVLRNRVYFFENDQNLLKFLTENPLSFWDQAPPEVYVPSVVSVVDAEVPTGPFTGARRPRTMAHHVAYNLGAVYLDLPKVLKWASAATHLPTLRKEALRVLLAEGDIPDELVSTALSCRLLCSDVCAKGAVLLNLPRNAAHLNAITANDVRIHKVLVYSDDPIVNLIDRVADVSTKMVSPRFSNAALVESFEAVRRNILNRQRLVASRRLAYPAPTYDASQSKEYLQRTLSVFKTYCPYTWITEGRLIDSFGDATYAAEYCFRQYYFCSDAYLSRFLESPQEYSGESGNFNALPTVLPKVLPAGAEVREVDLEHCGCCPVTLYETRQNRGLKGVTEPTAVLGSPSCIVEYDGKKYAMVDSDAVTKFIRQPWVYVAGAVLPHANRMPFNRDDMRIQPTEIYVRRMLYENTARAMLAVASTRPKFPGLSPQDSALKFVALHLKAQNGDNTAHRQRCYETAFQAFSERATLYKDIDLEPPVDEVALVDFRRRCDLWDSVQDEPSCWKEYQHPRPLTKAPEWE